MGNSLYGMGRVCYKYYCYRNVPYFLEFEMKILLRILTWPFLFIAFSFLSLLWVCVYAWEGDIKDFEKIMANLFDVMFGRRKRP